MKKKYLFPQTDIIALDEQDIIAVSTTGSLTTTGLDGIQYEEQAASGLSADVKANTFEWDIWQ